MQLTFQVFALSSYVFPGSLLQEKHLRLNLRKFHLICCQFMAFRGTCVVALALVAIALAAAAAAAVVVLTVVFSSFHLVS